MSRLSLRKTIYKYIQTTTPVSANVGEMWYNTSTGESKIYRGGNWSNAVGNWGPGSDFGYNMGGNNSVFLSTVDRLTFPFNSGTASIVGNLSASKYGSACCDGTDFITLFS